jgi:hypothetical protein
MAGEFKSVLREFSLLAQHYCENAQKVAPSPDHAKLVHAYEAGLATACASLEQSLRAHYDAAEVEWQRGADGCVALSGVLQMTKAANADLVKHAFQNADALCESAGIFETALSLVGDIPGVVEVPLPFAGGLAKLVESIDNFVDRIGKLLGDHASQNGAAPDGAAQDGPPVAGARTARAPAATKAGEYVVHSLEPGQWVTVHEGGVATYKIFVYQPQNADQVEVKVDGEPDPRLVKSYIQFYEGSTIEIALKTGGLPSVEVGTQSQRR